MRRLLLLRHAKAERLSFGAEDHARKLNERGRTDAPKIGAFMARHALVPDRVLVSTSARTRETWDLVARMLKQPPKPAYDKRLYDADPPSILKVITECGSTAPVLAVIGHNPGIQELAALLIASGDVEARQRLSEKFPTSALAVIEFALDDWSRLHPHSGRLDHFVSPRTLAENDGVVR